MSLVEFIRARIGTETNEQGGIDGSCVSMVNRYLQEVLGMTPVRANAVDWATARPAGLRWTPNGPDNFPSPGDVVVWRQERLAGIGPDGHVAVAVLATPTAFISFDQNWPEGAPAALVCHRSYGGVIGWHTPVYPRIPAQRAARGR